jgi:ferredoxin
MPVVVFESPQGAVASDSPDGARLLDLCDELRARVPFSCRSATCGTCLIDVLQGASLLEPPREDELEALRALGDDPGRRRFACQALVRPGAGVVRVRAAGASP